MECEVTYRIVDATGQVFSGTSGEFDVIEEEEIVDGLLDKIAEQGCDFSAPVTGVVGFSGTFTFAAEDGDFMHGSAKAMRKLVERNEAAAAARLKSPPDTTVAL